MVLFKKKATNFNDDVANTSNFKSFKYKTVLLENTVAQPIKSQGNGILRNATIVQPVKCFKQF